MITVMASAPHEQQLSPSRSWVKTPYGESGPPSQLRLGGLRRGGRGAASSSTVRSRPARTPTAICGIIRAAMSAIGSPQPPLCW